MILLKITLLAIAIVLTAAITLALWAHARDQRQVAEIWDRLESARESDPSHYDPAMVADLPEIAQRYFARAITPGTPLHRVVRLEMNGRFILNGNDLPMTAQQILAPPAVGFVWQAEIGSGLMRFAGSDGYHRAEERETSWTKFWLHGLIPLARIGDNPDHARAAATRTMLEAIWVPASLLPQFGAHWRQTGPDTAEVRFADVQKIEPIQITLDADGNPLEIWALRWTDANSERIHRLQPFGGRMLEMTHKQGFLIPARVELGNLWGTPDYLPFFLATITQAEF
jgi:hypothetical protein